MYLQDDGIRLSAVLDRPADGRDRYPLVMIVHGFTGNKEERHITAMSRMMNDIGCATLRADMYGHGPLGAYGTAAGNPLVDGAGGEDPARLAHEKL